MKSTVATILALLFVSGLFAIDVSGIQSGTWSPANNPYRLTGDVTIPAGSVLTIEPGVIVQATGNFRINAEGSIQAVGTETDSIRFENDQNPPTNLWKGIRLENDTEVSNFMHIVVEYAEYGINAVDSPIEVSYSRFSHNQRGLHLFGIGNPDPAPMNVHHNIIEHTQQNGILIPQNSNAWVHHNEVRYNGTVTQYYGAIQLANQSPGGQNNPIIEHNYIHSNFKQGITAWDVVGAGAINATIRYNHIEGNLTGIYLLNSSGIVHDNMIINNFIPGDSNSGAGMMIGGATSMPYIAGNTITGNFTGFYITSNAMPVLGDLTLNHPFAYGQNIIRDNIDESNTLHSVFCASYPNSGNVIKAENNDWGVYTADEINIGIMDNQDSAALPTVDFEPWFQPQAGITISGSYSWDPEDYDDLLPQELKLLLVDEETREILETHILTSNPFSIESFVEADFFALISGVDPEREIWAAAGGLEECSVFTPIATEISDLGNIYIDAWQHYEVETRGVSETIEGREVWPLYHSFLVFARDRVDYFYDEGDYRYIYKQEYLDDGEWQTLNFGMGQTYTKLTELEHGETWVQNYAQNGLPVQRFVTCGIDLQGGMSYIARTDMNLPIEQTFWGVALSYKHIYRYDESGYADRYLEEIQVQPGQWRKYHRQNSDYPPEFRLQASNVCSEQAYAMDFWWQAPAYNNVEYSEYRVYLKLHGLSPQLLGTVSFLENSLQVPNLTGSGSVDFWVVAANAEAESEPGNIIQFEFPISNQDLVVQPELNVYPNPVSFKGTAGLQVDVKGMNNATLKIFNLRGQQILASELREDHFSWNGRDAKGKAVSSGVYFMRIEDRDNRVQNRKIIVTK